MENSNRPAPQGGTDDAGKFRQYWHVLLERRWLIVFVVVSCLAAGFIYAFQATPIYEASARLEINPESAGVLSLREAISVNSKDQEYLQTQYRNLQSRTLIEKVIQKLKLDEDPRYKEATDRAEALNEDIIIAPIRLTRLVEIKTRHPVPSRARDIANTLLDLFLADNQDQKSFRALSGLRLLKQEQSTQEKELTAAIQALQDYRGLHGAVSLDQDVNVVYSGYRQAKEAYELQSIRSEGLLRLADEAQRWKAAGKDIADFPEVAKDPLVSQFKASLGASMSSFASITNRYGPKHQEYKSRASAVASDRQKLAAEALRAFNSMQASVDLEKANLEGARKKALEAEAEVTKLNDLKVNYDVLNRKKERAEAMFNLIIAKTKEYDLSSKDVLQNMRIVDQADVPAKPVKPKKPLIIVGSLAGGLAFALALAFFVNFLDDSVKSQEDVETYLGLPFLGYIPNIKSTSVVERDLQAHRHPTSGAAEGFRTLRASVSLARNAERLRNIGVSSTIPSEGKSLVASNFAIVTAQTGLKTLLVDADLRRPSVHKAFQIQGPIGLSAYLSERVNSLDDIVHATEVPNLDVVCCGSTPSNPSELISSKRMLQFLEEASTRYDRVILDCPPVSAVADPLVVGAMCDGLLFVTKFNKIRREHARRSVQRITDAGIHVVGLVLNDIDFEGRDSYYYSYHYYQNRYYASHYRTRPGSGSSSDTGKMAKPTEKKG
jgi:capsular exopolysaccharide synthesis family protein